jgi:predicted nucleotidyltransferase
MARIVSKIDRIVLEKSKQFITALRNEGLNIQRAYLYGSQAKGTAKAWSDIDIAIVAKNLSGDWHDDFVWLNLLADQVDARIEAIGYLPETFRDESPLVWEIKTTGVPLVGDGKNGKRRVSRKRAPSRRRQVSPRS